MARGWAWPRHEGRSAPPLGPGYSLVLGTLGASPSTSKSEGRRELQDDAGRIYQTRNLRAAALSPVALGWRIVALAGLTRDVSARSVLIGLRVRCRSPIALGGWSPGRRSAPPGARMRRAWAFAAHQEALGHRATNAHFIALTLAASGWQAIGVYTIFLADIPGEHEPSCQRRGGGWPATRVAECPARG